MSERQIVRIATPITEGNDSGYRLGYFDEMREGDALHETETATIVLNVGKLDVKFPSDLGYNRVNFGEQLTRFYAPFFASFSDDERVLLALRLSDMTSEQEPPPAKETKAQKAARLAAEVAANAPPAPVEPPAPPAPEPAPEVAAEAPAPVLPPPVAEAPAAPGWGTTPAV